MGIIGSIADTFRSINHKKTSDLGNGTEKLDDVPRDVVDLHFSEAQESEFHAHMVRALIESNKAAGADQAVDDTHRETVELHFSVAEGIAPEDIVELHFSVEEESAAQRNLVAKSSANVTAAAPAPVVQAHDAECEWNIAC